MNIAIVGTGYVGLVSGACFAETGAVVTCVDVDELKIQKLMQGDIPIYEPGLDELVLKNIKAGRLKFTTSLAEVLNEQQIVFSAVGTPPDEDGSADLKYVYQVAETIGEYLDKYVVVVTKSTVPVGTSMQVKHIIQQKLNERGVNVPFDVASNPEFLKEGNAIKDFMSPDRVVVGVESDKAKEILTRLATRISFMNDIANLCELVGANINMVRAGIGSDTRIGRKFLYAGCGYGGSCFPKDVKALIKTADDNGYNLQVLKAVENVNALQKKVVFDKLCKIYGQEQLSKKTIAIWGLAFKPDTDDMRDSTALVVIDLLLKAGCTIKVYDPVAMDECKRRIGDAVHYCKDMYDAEMGADEILLITEWKEFRLPSWDVVSKIMNKPLLIDGRNIFDRSELESIGFEYHCIGC